MYRLEWMLNNSRNWTLIRETSCRVEIDDITASRVEEFRELIKNGISIKDIRIRLIEVIEKPIAEFHIH